MTQELAVITGVGIGIRDLGKPILWFTTTTIEGLSALQILSWKQAEQFIEDSQVYEVKNLNNRSCVVETDRGSMKVIKFFK